VSKTGTRVDLENLLESIRLHQDTEFNGLATRDESRVYYIKIYGYLETSMYASSREEV
jgi:hypothetical protein